MRWGLCCALRAQRPRPSRCPAPHFHVNLGVPGSWGDQRAACGCAWDGARRWARWASRGTQRGGVRTEGVLAAGQEKPGVHTATGATRAGTQGRGAHPPRRSGLGPSCARGSPAPRAVPRAPGLRPPPPLPSSLAAAGGASPSAARPPSASPAGDGPGRGPGPVFQLLARPRWGPRRLWTHERLGRVPFCFRPSDKSLSAVCPWRSRRSGAGNTRFHAARRSAPARVRSSAPARGAPRRRSVAPARH